MARRIVWEVCFRLPGIYRCNGMPVTACDISTSPYRGRLYDLWSDQRAGPDNTDIFLIHSTDGGMTWGGMVKVNSFARLEAEGHVWTTRLVLVK